MLRDSDLRLCAFPQICPHLSTPYARHRDGGRASNLWGQHIGWLHGTPNPCFLSLALTASVPHHRSLPLSRRSQVYLIVSVFVATGSCLMGRSARLPLVAEAADMQAR